MAELGRTREEISAYSIATEIINGLIRMENFSGDPDMVLDDLRMLAHGDKVPQGVKDMVTALCEYFAEEE